MNIFVITGSRSFPFDRLVKAIDNAALAERLPGGADVFIQAGSSDYEPRHVNFARFLSRDEFGKRIAEADLVITHGGTGAIIGALKQGKRVVAVPRLKEFSEAVDDHQVELVRQFEEMGHIKACFNLDKIVEVVVEASTMDFRPYRSNSGAIIQSIDEYIQNEIIDPERGCVSGRSLSGKPRYMLVVSNMWPDETHPSSGVFVKQFVEQAELLGWACKLAVMKSADSKIEKIFRYIRFYVLSFLRALFGAYELVYVHYPSFSAPAVLAALRFRKAKLIVNVHGSDVLPVSDKQEQMHRYTERSLVIADRVVAPSEYFAQIVIEKYQLDPNKVYIYPSGGINPGIFHPLPDAEVISIREGLGLDLSVPTFCFAGRITEGKGWDTYLQALARLVARGKKLNAVLVGSGDQDCECDTLIRELGLTRYVFRMGLQPQSTLCELYNAADVFVFPGRRKSESLGLVAVEAMACGTPVIASDFAAPRYYVKDGVNGLKVSAGDVGALANAMELTILRPDLIGKMSRGALRTAEEYFSANVCQHLRSVLEL